MSRRRPCTLASLSLLAALLILTAPVQAGDAAARKVLGFSPDGIIFAFEQYSTLYDSTENVVEIQVIDTRTDSFVKGSPFSVRTKDDDERELDAIRAELMKKAQPTLTRLKVGDAGKRLPGKPSIELDDIGIYQMAEQPLAKTQEITLASGRKAKLAIAEEALGKASCYGAGGHGTFGDVIVQGLTLTLTRDDGASTILQMDKRLPKSRRCVTAYGIAEAWLHEAADGTQTLAVLIETVDAHEFHAGPNRRFMAVTKRLSQSR
jgi:predicted secreted protein